MKNISKKRAKENPIYLKLRKKFLLDHPVCQARLPGCMKELKDLVAGDKVVAYDKYDNRRIAIVERITKTLVVVNNIKYRKSNGFASGESYIFSRRIEIPKDEEQIKAIKLEYRKRIIIHRIHNLNLNDYPLEVLEKVYIELGGN